MKSYLAILSYIAFIQQAVSQTEVECLPHLDDTGYVQGDACGSLNSDKVYTKVCNVPDILPSLCNWNDPQDNYPCDTTKSYPGDSCSLDSSCNSNNCEDLHCNDKSLGVGCSENIDCNPGYFCTYDATKQEDTCQKQKKLGQSCASEYDCQNNYICYNETCIEYFSINAGEYCEDSDTSLTEGWSWVCTSAYCSDGECQSSKSLLKNTNFETCTENSECELNDGKSTGICDCTYDTVGTKKCKVQPGDTLYQEVIEYFKAFVLPYLEKTQGNCHTERRRDFRCFETYFTGEENERILKGYYVYDVKRSEAFDINGGSWEALSDNTFDGFFTQSKNEWEATYYQADDCSKYACATQDLNDTQCMAYDSSENLQEIDYNCLDDEYCPAIEKTDTECQKIVYEALNNLIPGDYCSENQNKTCKVGLSCQGDRCNGLKEGTVCLDSKDDRCDIGLGCIYVNDTNEYKCQDQLKEDVSCEDDLQCNNDCICVGDTCQKLLSVIEGEYVLGTCDRNTLVNDVCSKRQCKQYNDTHFECVNPLVSDKTMPIESDFDGDCSSNNGVVYDFAEVRCSHDDNLKTQCGAFNGDDQGASYMNLWKGILGVSQGKCHSNRRFNAYCWYNDIGGDDWKDFKQYYMRKYEFDTYPQITNADNCTKSVYWPEYNALEIDDDEYFKYEGASVLLLSLMLFLFLL